MDSRSRLPKPSGLPIPKSTTLTTITRTKSGLNLGNTALNRLPLSQDLVNFRSNNHQQFGRQQRALSPDLHMHSTRPTATTINRAKLRRSRSASDLRENIQRPLKQLNRVLPPIPSRFPLINRAPITSSTNSSTSSSNSLANKKPTTTATGGAANRGAAVKTGTTTTTTNAQTKNVAKRIPPYDYKARFNDLLEKHKVLKEKFEHQKQQLSTLDTLPEQYEESQNLLHSAQEEVKHLQSELNWVKEQNHIQSDKLEALANSLQKSTESLKHYKEKSEKLEKENASSAETIEKLTNSNYELTESNEAMKEELELCREQLFRANYERKELHNTVMDLRGNIRVFCRVRPPLTAEYDRSKFMLNYMDECSVEIQNIEPGSTKIVRHDFSFDQVFHEKSTQEDVFEMVSPLIQSALDGYNVCIFAYGQTGSGKTYTMDGISENLGIIPRTVDLLFESIRNYKRLGWVYSMKATFLEIYNETLYDLLNPSNRDLEIRMANASNKTDIYVSNLTEEHVTDEAHLRELIILARSNRATAATVGNERSSRSHAVTRIQLIGTHEKKQEMSIGTINLVDLAGSESPKTSTRMDETKNINRSLSELSNVVLALVQKNEHVPYRNSKLTYLLMPSLGGNSKTLMFINIAPFQDCFVESVKSLRFAASVNSCKLNKAKKNKMLNNSSNF